MRVTLEVAVPDGPFQQIANAAVLSFGRLSRIEAATLANLPPTEFELEFKRCHGLGFRQFQVNLRLSIAASLLCLEHLRVTEVGRMCGYDEVGAFSRAFKRLYRVSPRRYRKLSISESCQGSQRTGCVKVRMTLEIPDSSFDEVMAELRRRGGELSVQEAASIARLSKSRFSHAFGSATGRSFRSARALARVEKAIPLLTNTSMAITDLASELDYPDSGKFSRAFRKAFGVAPSVWREMTLKEGTDSDRTRVWPI